VDDQGFPFLGTEPVAVEFANTVYGVGANTVDFLLTADLIEQWFALVPAVTAASPTPSELGRYAARVRALRDAIRIVLLAAADGRVPDRAAVNTVNGAAAAAPTVSSMDWVSGSGPAAHRLDVTVGSTAVLGHIATSCIEVVTDPYAVVRRCEGPDCSLLFVRQHHRRRFCHSSCGHRDRQARYYRRHSTGATDDNHLATSH
jgi:predicted RNA-binding Zn ribbon-like protein